MGELASYRLSDFILFSATAYYRQFELYNQAIWPLHLVAVTFALLIFYALWRKPVWAGRVVAGVLIVSWFWVAWAFLYQRFYQIHVVANWYALAFVLQAGLIAWYGVLKNQFNAFVERRLRISVGSVLLIVAVVIYPFMSFLSGRSWAQFEMFALAPDPTALATIAILSLFKAPMVLYVIPGLWLVVSGVTLAVI